LCVLFIADLVNISNIPANYALLISINLKYIGILAGYKYEIFGKIGIFFAGSCTHPNYNFETMLLF
jgi:hypothetical protein